MATIDSEIKGNKNSRVKPRPTYAETRNKGYRFFNIQMRKELRERIDQAIEKQNNGKSVKNRVAEFIREAIIERLNKLEGKGEMEQEKAKTLDEIQALKVMVESLNKELKTITAQERNLPSLFPSLEIKNDKQSLFLEVFRLKFEVKKEPLTIEEVQSTMAKVGIADAMVEELMNDLEDAGKIVRGNYGRFSLHE